MFISPSQKKREFSLLTMVAVFSVCCITLVAAQNVTVPPIHDTPCRKRSLIEWLPGDKYDGPYVPFYYKPLRTDAQIEEAFQKASAKTNGPTIGELAGFALEFGRNKNTKRQQELTEAAMTKIEAISDDVRRATVWLNVASMFRSEGDMTTKGADTQEERAEIDPALVESFVQKAQEIILKIDGDANTLQGKYRLNQKSFLLNELVRQLAFLKKPETIVQVADAYPAAKSIGLPDWEDCEKGYGTYDRQPLRESAIKQAALIYVEAGELGKAKKLVHDKMRPKDAAVALRDFPGYLMKQGKTDEAAAVLLEAMQTAKNVEPESLRNDLFLQITSVMYFYQFYDELIESVPCVSDPEIRKYLTLLMTRGFYVTPGAHYAKAVAKILETTTPEDVIWWQAKTADAILKFRDDPSRLKDAFSKLLVDSLDAKVKNSDNSDNQEENVFFSDNMTIMIIDTALRSDCFRGMLDIVLALQGTPDQADKVRQAKMFAFGGTMSDVEKPEEISTIWYDFQKYFIEYNLTDPQERMILDAIYDVVADTEDVEHLKPFLEPLDKSVNKITDAKLKGERRAWLGSLQARVGMTEDALATARQIDDPDSQGRLLVMVANSHYRYTPICQWPKEMRNKTGLSDDDFDKIRTQPKPEDVRKTVDAIIRYVASIKEKERQLAVLNAIACELFDRSDLTGADWSCCPIFIDALRQSESFAPDVKRQYVKQLGEKDEP